MVSHGGFPNIDNRKGVTGGLLEPASLSHSIVTQLLREELGYQHLVVTDDLEMGAIARHSDIEGAVIRAFAAGQDMLLICSRADMIRRGFDALCLTARDGKLSNERLQASMRRIEASKARGNPALSLDLKRYRELAEETAALNRKLNYTYGGAV